MVAMVRDETREVHIVGGHHPDWPFEYYERMIQAIHAAHPEVQIKALTAAEVDYFWRRWKIERLFAWLHNFRRVVIRWEYYPENFLGMVQLACAVILLRYL